MEDPRAWMKQRNADVRAKLGLKKNHPVVQVVRGAPTALKQTVSGVAGGVAGAAHIAHRKHKP
jgi:hypothetical protein